MDFFFFFDLSSHSQVTLRSLQFFTADVEALYTNINVSAAIEDTMEFAKENRKSICTLGFKLSDIHQLLLETLGNSYFVYNKTVYLQLQGLFMGSNPAPLLATVKMWKLEKNSVYVDLRITMPTYGRFYDDLYGATTNSRRAQLLLNRIEQSDQDELIKLTLDFPPDKSAYTPYLNTEVRICEDGSVDTRLFRKPQKKLLTLHSNSHHSAGTKQATVLSMYHTAESVSSNEQNIVYSCAMVDKLLLNNGYTEKVLKNIREKSKNKKKSTNKQKDQQGNY